VVSLAGSHRDRPLATALRPNPFFQGLLAFAATIAADGRFYAPIGDATISAVDVRDIAAVAAAALTEAGHDGATYTLTGSVPITHAEIAAALTSALGRDITFIDIPPDGNERSGFDQRIFLEYVEQVG
jgi:uncharacterized protein YbjT (DUF2867 family)